MTFEDKARELVAHFRAIMEKDRGVDKQNPDIREVLSCQEAQVLSSLGDGAGTMGEIAACIHLSHSSVTGIVDKLEEKKFVRRERSGDDRRVVRVELTTMGKEMHRLVEEAHLEITRDVLRLLSSKEQDQLLDLYRKISFKLKETVQA